MTVERSHVSVRGEIENLMNRWCWAMDGRDVEAVADCYTEDALLITELPDREPTTLQGRSAILDSLTQTWSRVPLSGVKHVFTTYDIRQERDAEASLRSYFTSYKLVDGRPAVSSLGHQTAVLISQGEQWRIRERVHHVDGWLVV
jgi:uncharacterized protein (TIGR02246 family)